MRIYLLILFGLLFCLNLAAQVKLNTTETILGTGVQVEDKQYIVRGIEELLVKYADVASLYDASTNQVSRAQTEAFGQLFTNTAVIAPDYLVLASTEECSLMDFVEYTLDVSERLKSTGIPFTLGDVVLEKITYDERARQFYSEVTLSKKMLLGLKPDGTVVRYEKGRNIRQKMVLLAEKQVLTTSLIMKIAILSMDDIPTDAKTKATETPVKTEVIPEVKPNTNPVVSPPIVDIKKDKPGKKKKEKTKKDDVVTVEPKKDPIKKPDPKKTELPVIPAPVTGGATVLDISSASIDERLPADKRSATLASLQTALDNYIKYATLLEPSSGKVLDTYTENFERLFNDQAKIFDDLSEIYPEYYINYQDYITQVFENLTNSGVKYQILSAKLESVEQEFDGFFHASILIQKNMQHYLGKGKNNGLVEVAIAPNAPRVYNIRIRYGFNLGAVPLIDGIESGDDICVPDKEAKFLSFTGRLGVSILKTSIDAKWVNNINVSSTSTLGGQFQYSSNTFYKNSACKKPIFWTLGGGYQYSTFSTTINYRDQYIEDERNPTFIRTIAVNNAIQVSKIGTFEGIVGLRYRFISKPKSTAFIDLNFLPSYIITNNTGFDDENGNNNVNFDGFFGTYDINGKIDPTSFSSQGPSIFEGEGYKEYFGPASASFKKKSKTPDSSIGLSTRLGISYYRRINYTLGFVAGLDFNYNILSPLRYDAKSSLPRTIAEIESQDSFLHNFVKKNNQHSIGVRLGFYYLFTK